MQKKLNATGLSPNDEYVYYFMNLGSFQLRRAAHPVARPDLSGLKLYDTEVARYGVIRPTMAAVHTHAWEVILASLIFQIFSNAMGHAGFELHPRWWLSSAHTRWINTTTHHDLHHSGGFNRNYGLYFTWWDKWIGTDHTRYAATFAEVTSRTSDSGLGGSAKAPGLAPSRLA